MLNGLPQIRGRYIDTCSELFCPVTHVLCSFPRSFHFHVACLRIWVAEAEVAVAVAVEVEVEVWNAA
jgi:hypothetical protein